MKTETLDIKDFNCVEVSNTYEFEIVKADSFGISLTADEGLFKNLKVTNDGGILKVTHSKHIGWKFRLSRPSVKIAMPVINGLRVTGAVTGYISGFDSREDFRLEMNGASRVTADMTAGNMQFHIRGACGVEARGSAESLVIDVNGACELDMKDFTAHNAAIRLNGTSKCTIKVDGRLDARLAGVSFLNWIGDPDMGEIRASGLSLMKKIA
jgi:hypothetical protein